jgi:hypothetical protein
MRGVRGLHARGPLAVTPCIRARGCLSFTPCIRARGCFQSFELYSIPARTTWNIRDHLDMTMQIDQRMHASPRLVRAQTSAARYPRNTRIGDAVFISKPTENDEHERFARSELPRVIRRFEVFENCLHHRRAHEAARCSSLTLRFVISGPGATASAGGARFTPALSRAR